mmetsp:Transcript_58726/g.104756  ORF Transcript_58726/g.104756 Transcript_58726/m.104756 type:complete len:217 (+) Transcript_58726:311-961(+)
MGGLWTKGQGIMNTSMRVHHLFAQNEFICRWSSFVWPPDHLPWTRGVLMVQLREGSFQYLELGMWLISLCHKSSHGDGPRYVQAKLSFCQAWISGIGTRVLDREGCFILVADGLNVGCPLVLLRCPRLHLVPITFPFVHVCTRLKLIAHVSLLAALNVMSYFSKRLKKEQKQRTKGLFMDKVGNWFDPFSPLLVLGKQCRGSSTFGPKNGPNLAPL